MKMVMIEFLGGAMDGKLLVGPDTITDELLLHGLEDQKRATFIYRCTRRARIGTRFSFSLHHMCDETNELPMYPLYRRIGNFVIGVDYRVFVEYEYEISDKLDADKEVLVQCVAVGQGVLGSDTFVRSSEVSAI
ncbi:MAG: hypothetical protein WDZ59_15040 [Pirellulales bacterium]